MLYNIIVILHVIFAATVWGAPLGVGASIRRARAVSPEVFHVACLEGTRKGLIASLSGILTLVTGIVLILMSGGFGNVGKNFHIAMTLMIIALGISFTIMKPNGAKLVEASKPDQVDDAAIDAATKKLGMGSGILHLLWTIILGLMVFRF